MVRLRKSGFCILVTATVLVMGGLVEARDAELPQDWSKLNISQLNQVAQSLVKKGDAAKEERARLVAFLSGKFLGKPEAVASTGVWEWCDLLRILREDLSESQKTEWCQTLKSACVTDTMSSWTLFRLANTFRELNQLQEGREMAVKWMQTDDSWRSWPLGVLVEFSRSIQHSEGETQDKPREGFKEVQAARKLLFDHVTLAASSDRKALRTLSTGALWRMASEFKEDVPDARLQIWRDWIRERAGDPLVLRSMSLEDAIALANAMDLMGAGRIAREIVAGCCCGMAFPRSFSPEFRLTLMEQLGDLRRERRWRGLQEPARFLQIGRACWSAFSGSPPGLATLSDTEFTFVRRVLKKVDKMKLKAMTDCERFLARTSMPEMDLRDGGPDADDHEAAELFWHVILAEPNKRAALWQAQAAALPADSMSSGGSLKSLQVLVDVLAEDPGSTLQPEQVLADLMQAAEGTDVSASLAEMRDAQLLRGILAAQPALAESLKKARDLAASASDGANAAYAQVIADARRQGNEQAAALAEKEQLAWLCKNKGDLKIAQALAESLHAGGDVLDEPTWNATCRVLLKGVMQANPAERAALWTQGVDRLRQEPIHLSKDVLAELDELAKADAPLARRVLTDLLVLTPDVLSMQRLQQRRAGLLAAQTEWEQATAAAWMDVMLANATADGPVASLRRLEGVMKCAGRVEQCQALEERWLQAAGPGVASQPASRPAEADVPSLCDEELKQVAAKALAGDDKITARRKAYLLLFSGDAQSSLPLMHARLAQAGGDIHRLQEAWQDLAVASSTGLANSATSQPALTERETPAGFLAQVHRRRLIRWGYEAWENNSDELAISLWSAAVRPGTDRGDVDSSVRAILARVRCSPRAGEGVGLLETLQPGVADATAGRRLLLGIADLHYVSGQFDECLSALARAETLGERGEQASADMTSTMARARCLLAQQKFNDALEVLNNASQLQGTDEQRAEAMFLVGWIHLNSNRLAEATTQFEKLMSTYPAAPVTDRARRLMANLKRG